MKLLILCTLALVATIEARSTGRHLLALGGEFLVRYFPEPELYNTATNKWAGLNSNGPHAPRSYYPLVGMHGENIYVCGGYNHFGRFAKQINNCSMTTTTKLFANSTNGKTWEEMPPLPFPSEGSSGGIFQIGDVLYAKGDGPGIYEYNLQTKTWTTFPYNPPMFASGFDMVSMINTTMYIMHGLGHECTFCDLKTARDESCWHACPSKWSIRSTATTYNGKIYVAGNSGNGADANSFWVFNPKTVRWTQLAYMGQDRNSPGLAGIDGHIYACGGSDRGAVNTCERYSIKDDKWTNVEGMLEGRVAFTLLAV